MLKVSMVRTRKIGNTKFCSFLSQFIFLSQELPEPTTGVENAVEEEAEETTPTHTNPRIRIATHLGVQRLLKNSLTLIGIITFLSTILL